MTPSHRPADRPQTNSRPSAARSRCADTAHIGALRSHLSQAALCVLLALALLTAASVSAPAQGDITQTIDQGTMSGRIAIDDNRQLTLTPEGGDAVTMDLADVHHVIFGDDLIVRDGDMLLIDNDAKNSPAPQSASVRLRAGLHHFVLPYWQGTGDRALSVRVSGPGFSGSEIPNDSLYCLASSDAVPDPSQGIDEEGYRIAELPLDIIDTRSVRSRVRYQYYTGDENGAWENMSVFARMQSQRSGTSGSINYRVSRQSEHFGILFHGFIKIEQDGEYTFTLASDDGSRLYLGQIDQFSTALPVAVDDPEWEVTGRHHERLRGTIDALSDASITLNLQTGEERTQGLDLSLSHVAEAWRADAEASAINRANESETDDTVYLRDRDDPDKILSIPGRVAGFADDKLDFEYRGEVRHISQDRIVGIVFNHHERQPAGDLGYHQSLHLKTGQVLAGQVLAATDDAVRFAVAGGEEIQFDRGDLYMLRNEQGRVIDLTATEPMAVEETPFFSHTITHRVNQSLSGGPIVLYDNRAYDRGISVHSKTQIYYRLGGDYQRFTARFGLLKPGGALGNVTARVLGDGEVLFEQENITPATGTIDIDIDIQGVDRIVLEVDFGQGQNVGDRAAWTNPLLIRDSVE